MLQVEDLLLLFSGSTSFSKHLVLLSSFLSALDGSVLSKSQ